jgi:hypothetical protein
MIITTIEELRLHLPNHAYDDLESMAGAFRRSEADVLKEKIGHPLYTEMIRRYYAVDAMYRRNWLVGESEWNQDANDPWAELVYLCQQVVVFDAFGRSADLNAVSVNQSGINVVDAENYDTASKDFIAAYKAQMNREMHAAVNRLLVWLEECAEQVSGERLAVSEGGEDHKANEANGTNGQEATEDASSSSDEGSSEEPTAVEEIVELWKKSRFYYRHAELLVGTAKGFNEFVDIYESRERFVTLLPDLQYCQQQFIENELGMPLMEDLLQKRITGQLSEVERQTVRLAQQALCLAVETRSKMFNRKESKDEAIGAVARMVGFVRRHIKEYDQEAAQYFPQYREAMVIAEAREQHVECPERKPEPWVNNRKGNGMLVMPAVL